MDGSGVKALPAPPHVANVILGDPQGSLVGPARPLLLAASSTHVSNPRFLRRMTSYLPGVARRVIHTRVQPAFLIPNDMLRRGGQCVRWALVSGAVLHERVRQAARRAHRGHVHGRPVQVDTTIKPTFKAPGIKLSLRLKYDQLLSRFCFQIQLAAVRHGDAAGGAGGGGHRGQEG